MSQNLTFIEQVNIIHYMDCLVNKCSQLMSWILRTFISRERTVMLCGLNYCFCLELIMGANCGLHITINIYV